MLSSVLVSFAVISLKCAPLDRQLCDGQRQQAGVTEKTEAQGGEQIRGKDWEMPLLVCLLWCDHGTVWKGRTLRADTARNKTRVGSTAEGDEHRPYTGGQSPPAACSQTDRLQHLAGPRAERLPARPPSPTHGQRCDGPTAA